MLRFALISGCAFVFASNMAIAASKEAGKIVAFECGDNCYLTIKTNKGKEITALCAAAACDPWNEATEIPAAMIGRKVWVTVTMGKQYDGGGNLMGTFPSIRSLKFKP